MSIPVTIVTGFLGSGKTTLINQVLDQERDSAEKTAIIVNEFGEAGIDHHLILDVEESIYELNNGCICCTLREDILATLLMIDSAFSAHNRPLERVIVETTGLAEPLPIIQTIAAASSVQELFHIDCVLTVVDTQHYTRSKRDYQEVRQQILYADRLILSKTEKLLPGQLSELVCELSELNPLADIKRCSLTIPFPTKDFFHTQLFHKTPEKLFAPAGHTENASLDEHHHDHHHHGHDHDGFSSITLRTDQLLDSTIFVMWLNWLLANTYGQLYRYKGILSFQNEGAPLVLQGVAIHYGFEEEPVRAQPESVVVLIGKHLPHQEIIDTFEEMIEASQATAAG